MSSLKKKNVRCKVSFVVSCRTMFREDESEKEQLEIIKSSINRFEKSYIAKDYKFNNIKVSFSKFSTFNISFTGMMGSEYVSRIQKSKVISSKKNGDGDEFEYIAYIIQWLMMDIGWKHGHKSRCEINEKPVYEILTPTNKSNSGSKRVAIIKISRCRKGYRRNKKTKKCMKNI